MAITEFDRLSHYRRQPAQDAEHHDRRGLDGQTVGAVILCGWVWAVFVFLGWGLLHAAHLPVG